MSAPDQSQPPPLALAEAVASTAHRHQVPGIAVGVYHAGRESYACHGVTSIEHPLPVDERTRFQVGSTGKSFTATAILRLAEQGRLDVHAPVRRYLPSFRVADPGTSETVTVLNLLNHTAGWRDRYLADTGPGDDALERAIALMGDQEQSHPSGEVAEYNNSGICVAGRILEVIARATFEASINELLLAPLQLGDTSYHAEDAITHRFAVGHHKVGGALTVARPWNMPRSSAPAGAGLASSVRDQIRYARFHLGHLDEIDVLSDETLRLMQSPNRSLGDDHVGIPWTIATVDGRRRLCSHGGATLGQQSAFEFSRDADLALVVLTNSDVQRAPEELVTWVRRNYADIQTEFRFPGGGRTRPGDGTAGWDAIGSDWNSAPPSADTH